MRTYFDKERTWDEVKSFGWGFTKDAARFDARKARKRVLAEEEFNYARLLRYVLRPFELKWCYYCPVRPLWNEPRPSLFKHTFDGNSFIVSRPAGVAHPEGVPFYWTKSLGDFDFIRGHSYHFPLRLAKGPASSGASTPSFLCSSWGNGSTATSVSILTRTLLCAAMRFSTPSSQRL